MFGPEFQSWFGFHSVPNRAQPPQVGDRAPESPNLSLEPSKRTVVTFLRHCGCPFAEQTFLRLRESAKKHSDIDFIAVSHSNKEATEKWHKSLPNYGSETGNLRIVVDSDLESHGQWGLGASGFLHVLDPRALSNVFKLQKEQGISVRPTESGSRWQTAGSFAIDENKNVRWGGPAARSDFVPDFEDAVRAFN
jgi:hypothetical protein